MKLQMKFQNVFQNFFFVMKPASVKCLAKMKNYKMIRISIITFCFTNISMAIPEEALVHHTKQDGQDLSQSCYSQEEIRMKGLRRKNIHRLQQQTFMNMLIKMV